MASSNHEDMMLYWEWKILSQLLCKLDFKHWGQAKSYMYSEEEAMLQLMIRPWLSLVWDKSSVAPEKPQTMFTIEGEQKMSKTLSTNWVVLYESSGVSALGLCRLKPLYICSHHSMWHFWIGPGEEDGIQSYSLNRERKKKGQLMTVLPDNMKLW